MFTDMKTDEHFDVICEPFEVHSIDRENKEHEKWCEGRIILRREAEIYPPFLSEKDIKIAKEYQEWLNTHNHKDEQKADLT